MSSTSSFSARRVFEAGDISPEVVKGASALLTSDPEQMVFATASEPDPPATKTPHRRGQRAAEGDQSESSSSSSQDEVLEKLRKNWLGEGISGGRVSGKGHSKRDKKGKFVFAGQRSFEGEKRRRFRLRSGAVWLLEWKVVPIPFRPC